MTITATPTVILIAIIVIITITILTVDPGGIDPIMIDDAMTIPIDEDDVPDMTKRAVTAMDDVWMVTIDVRMDHLPSAGIIPTRPRIVAWGIRTIHHREFRGRLREIQVIHDVDRLLDTERNERRAIVFNLTSHL